MRTRRFTVEQVAHALKRVQGGVVVGEVCRELGIVSFRSRQLLQTRENTGRRSSRTTPSLLPGLLLRLLDELFNPLWNSPCSPNLAVRLCSRAQPLLERRLPVGRFLKQAHISLGFREAFGVLQLRDQGFRYPATGLLVLA